MLSEFELLEYVHKYYPIGLQSKHNVEYPGIVQIKNLISEKINALTEGKKLPINDIISRIKNYKKDLIVEDWSFLQTPSYTIFIKIDEHSWKGLFITDTLCIDISIVAPYYTIYIARNYSYPELEKKSKGIYFLDSIDIGISELIKFLKLSIAEVFPSSKFISLFELSKIKIYGGPLGDEQSSDCFPIYNFLFNNSNRSGFDVYK